MKLFISYTHRDSDFVSRLESDLRAEYDVRIDVHSFVPDVPLILQISALIETSNYFLPIISTRSLRSGWVEREFSLAFPRIVEREIAIVPIVLGRAQPSSLISHVPYVRFKRPSDDTDYMKTLQSLLQLLRRSPIVSGNLVLSTFQPWGNLDTKPDGDFGLVLDGPGGGACGLVYHSPIRIGNASHLRLIINGSSKSDFTKWSTTVPKMLKVQINDHPILPVDRTLLATDDIGYLAPADGEIAYAIPRSVSEKRFIEKIEFVFGNGVIKHLTFHARIS